MRGLGAVCLAAGVSGVAVAKTPSAEFHASIEVLLDESAAMGTAASGRTWFQRAVEGALKAVDGKPAQSPNGDLSWRVIGGADAKDDAACEATRLIVSPGISPAPVLLVTAKETPRGPRPLAAAIEGAASDLPNDGRQRGLVLVTSGADTCGRDPCAVAADLRSSVGLGTVLVLLVGSDGQAAERLACLGTVVPVPDPTQLRSKLAEAVEALDQPADVTVTAMEDGHDLAARVELFPEGDTNPTLRGQSGDSFRVLAGTYQVHIARARAPDEDPSTVTDGWRRDIEIVAGSRLSIRVPIGVEQAQITARVMLNGAPAPLGTKVAVFHVGETSGAVATGSPGETLHVPAGRYDVRAEIPGGPLDGIQVWKPEVKIASGQSLTVSLVAVQKRGSLKVDVFAGSQPLNDAQVLLLPPGRHIETQAIFSPGIEIPVPAGKYTIAARYDTAGGRVEVSKDDIAITPDQTTTLKLDVGALGRIEVDIAGHVAEDGIAIGLMRAGQREPVGTIEAFSEYVVPPGSYDLRVEGNGAGSKVYFQRDAVVVAGEKTVVKVRPPR